MRWWVRGEERLKNTRKDSKKEYREESIF